MVLEICFRANIKGEEQETMKANDNASCLSISRHNGLIPQPINKKECQYYFVGMNPHHIGIGDLQENHNVDFQSSIVLLL